MMQKNVQLSKFLLQHNQKKMYSKPIAHFLLQGEAQTLLWLIFKAPDDIIS